MTPAERAYEKAIEACRSMARHDYDNACREAREALRLHAEAQKEHDAELSARTGKLEAAIAEVWANGAPAGSLLEAAQRATEAQKEADVKPEIPQELVMEMASILDDWENPKLSNPPHEELGQHGIKLGKRRRAVLDQLNALSPPPTPDPAEVAWDNWYSEKVDVPVHVHGEREVFLRTVRAAYAPILAKNDADQKKKKKALKKLITHVRGRVQGNLRVGVRTEGLLDGVEDLFKEDQSERKH